LPSVAIDPSSKNTLENLKEFLSDFPERTLFVTDHEGRLDILRERLAPLCSLPAQPSSWNDFLRGTERIGISVATLNAGFILSDTKLAVITESDLYPDYVRPKKEKKIITRAGEAVIKELGELSIGCTVVHDLHGIGRYLGLERLSLAEGESEFLVLEYAGGDKLYVPIEQLALVSRYIGIDEPLLHKLGSGQWEKARQKAWIKARDTASELLETYAKRHLKKGRSYTIPQELYQSFCASFPFEETEDQKKAIEAVLHDLASPIPMDRLVCGDVGFGKTEVAMRAAFVVAMQGAQVAVLVPTTLLAEQHFTTFSDRFANWPLKIAELSRFRSPKEQKAILEGLANGKFDIVIGTHKLLQEQVKFKDLGLLIIDEEHRFGVRQKEKMKALRAEVDLLTLTATPIPRSIAMAIEGIKGLSLITTPPRKRLSVKTFVCRNDKGLAREAIIRELHRGGQVYYLHNDIDSIERHAEQLRTLVPEAKIRIAHAQMPERELEVIMRDFYLKRFNVLVCTTIIESGIDIPSANTILVDQADRFGLAQLHQLRGRVGRSHHQAYCYLFIHDWKTITKDAQKRLEAIESLTDLGSGFQLAMHDLEIRGAGEILGEAQSGQVAEIGMQHYSVLLEKAVASLKNGTLPEHLPETELTEIKLHAPCLLPETYCPDTHDRLIFYKRLAKADDEQTLYALLEELKDRFGQNLPPAAQLLLTNHRLRILAKQLGVVKIDSSPKETLIVFGKATPLDPLTFLKVLEKFKPYRFSDSHKLHLAIPEKDPFRRAEQVCRILSHLLESITCANTPLSKAAS
jgi:transcription-repair coupling factor (superfamily II helicase)